MSSPDVIQVAMSRVWFTTISLSDEYKHIEVRLLFGGLLGIVDKFRSFYVALGITHVSYHWEVFV